MYLCGLHINTWVIIQKVSGVLWERPCVFYTQIAKFMGQHGAHLGPISPRWAPCWPHEPCFCDFQNLFKFCATQWWTGLSTGDEYSFMVTGMNQCLRQTHTLCTVGSTSALKWHLYAASYLIISYGIILHHVISYLHSFVLLCWDHMGQVTKLRLSCYIVLLSTDSKTR